MSLHYTAKQQRAHQLVYAAKQDGRLAPFDIRAAIRRLKSYPML